MTTLSEAAQARAASMRSVADRPSERRSGSDKATAPRGAVRAQVHIAGDTSSKVGGCASVVERGYEMWDAFGPYTEIVSRDAFNSTLASDPVVEYTVNHGAGGALPMASTRNGTLTLSMSDEGLDFEAVLDSSRNDVADLLKAIQRGDMAEASFKFRITAGQWSPDYTEYRITEVDLNRGDVSSVNFGANPSAYTTLRAAATALMEGRALDPEDVNIITQALAKFAAIDNIVDEAQAQIAEYLGVPNPDDDAPAEPRAEAKPVEIRLDETHHIAL